MVEYKETIETGTRPAILINGFNITTIVLKYSKLTGLPLLLIFLIWSCASTGSPSGGPKDTTPPVVKRSRPEANSLNFQEKEIIIEFDEIIQVKEIFQKLVVSPPVNKQPVVSARGRELKISFEEDLQPNTTYTIDFADAISDNNENNPLVDFRFSFSTGTTVDSLSISGYLFNASDLTPIAGALVMVHKNHADSAFKTLVPVRLAKTNQKGGFSVQNVSPGQYRVYAIEDGNRNYIYDQPGERIAWHSNLIEPKIELRSRIDSISPDSSRLVKYNAFLPDSLNLFMVQEDNAIQYLKDTKRPLRNKIDFIFNRPLKEALDISLVGDPENKKWLVYEHSVYHDSVSVWLTDSAQIKRDSLFINLKYEVLDSLKLPDIKSDTLNAFYFVQGGETKSRKKDRQPKEIPGLKASGLKKTVEILSEFDIVFPTPVNEFNREALKLFQFIDTIPHPVDFELIRDSIRIRRFIVDYPWEPGFKYQFEADSAAFVDIYGLASEPIKQTFTIKPIDSYGIIFVDAANSQNNWLLQILNKQEKLVRQSIIPTNGKIGFQFLKPGDYFLRIIVDINNNGKWDTGDFDSGTQPETIFYYPDAVNVRANWDILVQWNPLSFDIHGFVEKHRQKQGQKTR